MGISIIKLEEGCCQYLNSLPLVDGDKFTDNEPTVDNILECDDKYFLIEEKSFLLNFFRKSCEGKRKFGHFIKDGELNSDFLDFLASLDIKEKRKILKNSSEDLLSEIPKKVEVTLDYLEKEEKKKNSLNVILYCESGTEIDKIASILFSRYNDEEENTILECNQLEKFLKIKGCA
ncbi:MAG: Unknown protein [uncultured Sulfurovum sp.]|uniref:Uncharacterized protein n=1 Tax=uncultured Sulfurovum sp. TaxID=269237 RepID=A0A6S6TTC7_9BACT|nr:MAG: Unknown protein [uncultured Sulfurovum sp.]